jgi:hypothetical protein
LAIRALPTLLKKSTKEANKKTLQILCEKVAPTEKTFGPHVDKEERSRHKESASVALKTIGVEGYSKEVSKEFCGKCVPFFDRVLGDANKATVHDDATEILQILCETKAEFVEAKDVSSLIQTTISKIEDKTYGQTSRKRCAGILASLSRAANAKELADVSEKTAARCEKALAEKDVIGCELGAFTLGMIAAKDGGGKRLVAESATGGGGGAKKTKKGGANGSLASKTVVPVLSKLCTTLVEKMENNEEADEAFASIAEQSLMALETSLDKTGTTVFDAKLPFAPPFFVFFAPPPPPVALSATKRFPPPSFAAIIPSVNAHNSHPITSFSANAFSHLAAVFSTTSANSFAFAARLKDAKIPAHLFLLVCPYVLSSIFDIVV